jgi:hypothetical protein
LIAWPTAALLVAIVVLEGARRVTAGDVAFRRLLAGSWTAGELDAERRRWTLVSWLPPIWTTIVVPTQRAVPVEPPGALPERLRAVRPWFVGLLLLGALMLVALVGGIPYAERRSTGAGVLLAIGTVLLLALATASLCAWARARLGLSRSPAWAALSPFAAPFAAERLLEETVARFAAVAVAQKLLPTDQFRVWIRPRAYDAQSQADPDLLAAVDRDELAAILAPPPPQAAGDARLFCPRCAAVYRDGTECSDCAGVTLLPFPDDS